MKGSGELESLPNTLLHRFCSCFWILPLKPFISWDPKRLRASFVPQIITSLLCPLSSLLPFISSNGILSDVAVPFVMPCLKRCRGGLLHILLVKRVRVPYSGEHSSVGKKAVNSAPDVIEDEWVS